MTGVTLTDFLLTALAGFAAGFLDAIVGGGGLILTPAMLNLYPELSILQIIGTQRTSSIFGTTVAAYNYLRHLPVSRQLLVAASVGAAVASAIGVQFAKALDPEVLKLLVLAVCVVLAIYTVFKREFGTTEQLKHPPKKLAMVAGLVGAACGFYNGLIGPGTGTLMVFGFVAGLGVNFLKSSAISKVANVAADLSSWTALFLGGFVIWAIALPLIIGNMLGSWVGSRLAILKGSAFVRWVFLAVVLALIARYAWAALMPT
jgi:uncharacterized protein